MNFFKPEDFDSWTSAHPQANITGLMAGIANAKLERESQILYSYFPDSGHFIPNWISDKSMFHKGIVTHKALLINIEPNEIEEIK